MNSKTLLFLHLGVVNIHKFGLWWSKNDFVISSVLFFYRLILQVSAEVAVNNDSFVFAIETVAGRQNVIFFYALLELDLRVVHQKVLVHWTHVNLIQYLSSRLLFNVYCHKFGLTSIWMAEFDRLSNSGIENIRFLELGHFKVSRLNRCFHNGTEFIGSDWLSWLRILPSMLANFNWRKLN